MSITEITRLKEENEKLRNQLQLTSSYMDSDDVIIDKVYEWVWEVNTQGVYTYVSQQVTSVLGYHPEELIGKTPFDFMNKDEAERVGKLFSEILSQEVSFSKLVNACLHKHGHSVYTETSGQPVYDKNGNLTGYRGIDFDRTQEAATTQILQNKNSNLKRALNNEHELLRNVTNTISDLLFYKDTDYRYIGCNQAFSNFLGLPVDFIIGKTDHELFSSQFADTFRSMDKRVMEEMRPYSNYEWINHSDGRRLYVFTQKKPLFNTQSTLIGMVGTLRDLTKEHILEEQLQESKDFLIDAQSIAKVGHWDWDIPSGKLCWSDEIYNIFGYKAQEFSATYDAFLDTIHPDDRHLVSDAVDEAVDSKKNYNIYHRIVLPDGAEKTVHEVGHAIYDEMGLPVRMIGTVQDVTQITKVQKELSRQKEAFEKIFEHSSDGAFITKDGKFIDCNQAAVRMLGLSSKEQALDLSPSEISPQFQPDGRRSDEKYLELMLACMEKGYHRYEWLYNKKSGENFWVDVISTRLILEEGTVIHSAWRDIGQQKKLEAELEQQKEDFENIFEYASDGTILIEENRFVNCNQAIVKMFRAANREAILQLHPTQLSPLFQADGMRSYEKAEKMMEICKTEGQISFEWIHLRQDGEKFWAEVLLTHIEINNKSVIHASLRDITERKILKNTLETSNVKYQELVRSLDHKVKEQSAQMIKQSRMAQMGELLSMIAHQWRQPLSSIAAIASAINIKISLSKEESENEESNKYLSKQMNEIGILTQALSNTINDFRTLYKPDKIMKYSKLHNPVERALKLLGMSFTRNRVCIEKIYGADLSLLMHENEIMQVLLNLLKNADDNFEDKGTIEPWIKIETKLEDLSAVILVTDNGGGIDKQIIESIFDPYFSTKHDKNGTGLGLYMSKIIIEQHHKGRLDVYNTDQGVCFRIELIIQ